MPYVMTPKRAQIKQLLIDQQAELCAGRWIVSCELCGKSKEGLDMHELFLDKGDVQGCSDAVYQAVHETALNLQLLCNQCNMVRAKTTLGRSFLMRKKLDTLGRLAGALGEQTCVDLGARQVTEWIKGLGLKDPQPYVLRVLAAAEPRPVQQEEVE